MGNKLLEKYRNFSPAAKASFWFVFSNVMLRGISFITLPIFSRILTTEEYGIISVYTSWETIIQIISTLTLNGGVFNVILTKHYDDSRKYISSLQGLSTTLTIIFFLITLIFIKPFCKISSLSPFLVICIYLDILSLIPYGLWVEKQRYDYNYKPIIIITLLLSILNPFLGYFAVCYCKYKAEARIMVGVFLNLIIGVILFIQNFNQGKIFFDKNIWKYATKFNIVLVPHYLSMQILNHSDRIMIVNMCSSSDAGIYSVAYSFGMLLTLITNGIRLSYVPFQYRCLKSGNYEKLRESTTLLLFGIAVITIAMICVIPDIFKFMLPESYYSAIWVIPPVAGAAFFQFLYPLFGSVEFYYEAKKYVTMASLFGAGINIILNYIFIKLFGFIASAYTTLFCYIAFSVFHYIAMMIVLKRQGNTSKLYDIKMIILISVVLLVCIVGITILYSHTIARWVGGVMVSIIVFFMRKKIFEFVREVKE